VSPIQHLPKVSFPQELLWAFIGLILTICGTLIEGFITVPPWLWIEQGVKVQSLGITYQIGAVLLTGCVGGKNAGAISQIAYLVLGISGLEVFRRGGGLSYFQEPTFGYLIGFIFGAWICGYLAFKATPKLELLAFSCLCGLLVIHGFGLSYLTLQHLIFHSTGELLPSLMALFAKIQTYTINVFPGQLILVCATTVLSYCIRQLMFY
jgi:biotin transport system substrate-specific component